MEHPFNYQSQTQSQWHPPPVFAPQWHTLPLSQVSFTNQTADTGIISREDNEEHILGSIDYYAFLLLRTEENARRLLGTDTTGNYQQSLGVQWPDYSPLTNTLSPGVSQGTQLPEFPPAEDTFNNHHHRAESPYILDCGAARDDDPDNMANANSSSEYESTDLYNYSSPGSSISSEPPSCPTVYDLSYQHTNPNYPNYLPLSNDIDSPTYATGPDGLYGYSSSSCSVQLNMVSNTALGTFESVSESISTYPTSPYPVHYSASPYDDAVNAAPSNASLPHDMGPPSPAYSSRLNRALERSTFDGTDAQVSNSWDTNQNADVISMVPIKMANNTNPQQTRNEESAWEINFFDEEEIEPLTINSDHDTGAGPSAGSSVAASMLDIERARQGQSRDVWPDSVSAAPEKQAGKGKRKADDAPEPTPASKKMRTEAGVSAASTKQKGKGRGKAVNAPEPPPRSKKCESRAPGKQMGKGEGKAVDVAVLPSAPEKIVRAESPVQSMGNVICADSAEDGAICLGSFKQSAITAFVHCNMFTPSSGEEQQSTLAGESMYATLKIEKSGELTARQAIVARDGSHAPRKRIRISP